MRTLLLSLIGFLLLGSASALAKGLSDRPGQLLTVSVQGASAAVDSVVCDLGPDLLGLELRRDGVGSWSGSFAVLPDMVSTTLRPTVRLYDEALHEQPRAGLTVQMAGSTFDREGFATVLSDRDVLFVFDSQVAADSITFLTRDGTAVAEPSGNTFRLPFGVAPLNVAAITASRDGLALVFQPEWNEDNLATSEEELELAPSY